MLLFEIHGKKFIEWLYEGLTTFGPSKLHAMPLGAERRT